MEQDVLKALSPKKWSKHRILNEELDIPSGKTPFQPGSLVWAKIDTESKPLKRNKSGIRVYSIWIVSEDLKHLAATYPDIAQESLSDPLRKGGEEIRPTSLELNQLMNLVKKESERLIAVKKRQAIILQQMAQNKSQDGYAHYQFDASPIKIKSGSRVVKVLKFGDRFKIKRLDTDDNFVVFEDQPKVGYHIDDYRLYILFMKSKPLD